MPSTEFLLVGNPEVRSPEYNKMMTKEIMMSNNDERTLIGGTGM